ncbi:MAG: N-acetyl-gamma-glutamyl-phosphate reductase [bacterium]|nr:N-acetyl-gamma-glutamyl-phosphate reductase [bacterium]
MSSRTCAIVGASGYTGRELLRLLTHHSGLAATVAMTARPDTDPAPPRLPHEPTVDRLDLDRLATVDGVFLCTPHGAAATIARHAIALGKPTVDLSADFRLSDEAVYGLTEHKRDELAAAQLVANPGCYPTSILLPLLPLLAESLIGLAAPIVADSKSGVSGAGKAASERTHFGNVHENFLAYGVGTHRHTPEIHRHAGTERIVFTPHLLPAFRGILSTIYVTPTGATTAEHAAKSMRDCLATRYAQEPFVTVYADGQPELCCVQHTNECHIAVAASGPLVVITAAIDNLGKGAAGQALQNMNLLLDLPETAGLL